MEFSKYEGTGNDFIVVFDEEVTPELAIKMCHRNFGVGADGVIVLKPSEVADFSFVLFNADGSLGEVSGNGLRCVGKFLHDKGHSTATSIKVDAGGEIKVLDLIKQDDAVTQVRVDMGIPADKGHLQMNGQTWHQIDTGNPHVVTMVDDPQEVSVAEIGEAMEHDPVFPDRTNVHFIKVEGDRIKARFWERGVGETLACGTGSVASLIASGLDSATVVSKGGDLLVEKDPSGRVFLTGPAKHVFDGRLP
jgi:diaminopimelate epimerase